MNSLNIRINTQLYYVAHILSGASFIVPISILYYLSKGLQFSEIGILESIFLLASLLLEIPTGALADRLGRKGVSACGFLTVGLATILIGIGHSFVFFALVQVIFGIGAALRSGADTSLLYDSLIEEKQEGLYSKIEGRSYAFFSIAGVIAAPVGAYLFSFNKSFPFFIDGFFLILAAITYMLMCESKLQSEESAPESYVQTMKSGLRESMRNVSIRRMMLVTIFVSLVFSIFATLISQPLLVGRGLSIIHIGYLFSFALVIQSLGSLYAHKISSHWDVRTNISIIVFLVGISLLAMALSSLAIFLLSFSLFFFIQGFQYPVLKDYFQIRLPSSLRTTIISTQNTLENLIAILIFPLAGFVIDKILVTKSLVVFGVITSITGLLFILLRTKWPIFTKKKETPTFG